MIYRLKDKAGCDFIWRDQEKNRWHYTKERKEKLYGDVRKKSILESKDLLVSENRQIQVEPCKKKLGFFERSLGYLPCTDENDDFGYIRIVERAKVKLIVFILALLLLIGALGYIGFQFLRPADDTPIEIKSGELVNTNPDNIRLPGIEAVHADAGNTRVNQLLLNVEGNAVNLTYEIRLEETDELLYRSKVIKPGYGVREFDLLRPLEKGEYPITITALSSAQDDETAEADTAYNAGQLKATLIVE